MKTAKRGRPTVYTEEIAAEICERLAAGQSLCEICAEPHLPSDATVSDWSAQDSEARPGFSGKYARARQAGLMRLADELLAISDADYTGPDGFVCNAAVQQARLKSDNRKWLLSKLLPRQFGDRVVQELVGDSDRPVITRIELIGVTPPERREDPVPVGGDKVAPPLKLATAR